MDSSSAPVQPPVSEQVDQTINNAVLIDLYTLISALMLFATFSVVVTQFRLWHTNKFLKNFTKLVNDPICSLINQSIGIVATYQNEDNLHLIWVVILLIAYDNVFTISSYSLFERVSYRLSREFVFLSNCVIILVIIIINYKGAKEFHNPLLVLMSLVLAKFLIRNVSFVFADRAYGLKNINLVAQYMKSEHKLTPPSDAIDPTSMKGYKYLVMGEETIKSNIKAPDYSPEIELTADVITVEEVWRCKEGLLHPSVDKDGGMKDVCLSFALFKLLRRRIFGYAAEEAQQPKTRQLIFDGLLSSKGEVDKTRVFRVIKMELGFLRDLLFTRYPVGFAFGFPLFNLIFLGAMIGVTIWFATIAFKVKMKSFHFFGYHKVDYYLTDALLIVIIFMDFFEVLTYVFCDWTRVMMICRNVKCKSSLFGYKVFAFFCKPRFRHSVNSTLGQYSLLSNCHKTCVPWYYLVTKIDQIPSKKGKAVPLTDDVKKTIIETLVESQGDLTNGNAALQKNEMSASEELQRKLNLKTPVHTIMVWHIATSFCEIHQAKVGGNKESIKSHLTVATHLSNYCAYLVAFRPALLPVTGNLVKYMFLEIVKETSVFFGTKTESDAKYEKMMGSGGGDDQKIIYLGSELGQLLTKKIPDDAQRWKLMAEFWSEYILYLAPSGSTRAHIEQLGNGSEFITHLWALLYHAGIIDTTNAEYHP